MPPMHRLPALLLTLAPALAPVFALGLAPATALALTPDEAARIELVTYGTLYGAALGAYTAIELDLGLRPAAWLSAGLAGGALWGTWEAAQARGLDAGQAALIASAGGWAMADVIAVGVLSGAGDETLWLSFGAGALAAGAAFWAAPYYDGGPGDISLVNSGGIWTPIAATILAVTLEVDPFVEDLVGWVLAFNLLGLATGIALATQHDPSREQVLYLDLGLLAGGLGGGLFGVIAAVSSENVAVGGLLTVGGMVAGAAIAVANAGFDGGSGESATGSTARTARSRPPLVLPLWAGAW